MEPPVVLRAARRADRRRGPRDPHRRAQIVSIDQQRYNAQFGGQTFRAIRNGRVAGMPKDVAYQIRTPEFWNATDLCGGEGTYFTYGTNVGDGKGQPAQSNAASHGCPATRHRGITVINTARSA